MQTPVKRERWRYGLPGGLDNAIVQAEERGFENMYIVDADCHLIEPFRTIGKYLKNPLRNVLLAPDPEEDPIQKGLFSRYKEIPTRDPTYFTKGINVTKRPEISRRGEGEEVDDIVGIFTQLMVDLGIKVSLVLPTIMLYLPLSKPEVEAEVANAYMDFMLDNFLGKYPEIKTLLYVPSGTPEMSVELIDRVGREKGVLGLMISGTAPLLGGSDAMDPVYEAAQKLDLPVCFHANRDLEGPYKGMEFVGAHALSFPFSLIRHLTSVVMTGVPVRFPNLKFCWMEGGISWLPWLYHRLDDEYTKRRIEAPLLNKLPSEYMKGFYYTSQPLEQSHTRELEHIFNLMDLENRLMYASDYSHWDFDVPSVIYDLPFLSETAKRKILGETAARFFKLK